MYKLHLTSLCFYRYTVTRDTFPNFLTMIRPWTYCMTITHLSDISQSNLSALPASFCHSSPVPLNLSTLSHLHCKSAFTPVTLISVLSCFLFLSFKRERGKKKVLPTHSEKCHFICLTLLSFWLKVKPFNFLPENH